jgi:hypothetical protein
MSGEPDRERVTFAARTEVDDAAPVLGAEVVG